MASRDKPIRLGCIRNVHCSLLSFAQLLLARAVGARRQPVFWPNIVSSLSFPSGRLVRNVAPSTPTSSFFSIFYVRDGCSVAYNNLFLWGRETDSSQSATLPLDFNTLRSGGKAAGLRSFRVCSSTPITSARHARQTAGLRHDLGVVRHRIGSGRPVVPAIYIFTCAAKRRGCPR